MADTRIDPTAAPSSPTGVPVIPVGIVPWLVALVGAAGVACQVLPEHTIGFRIASAILALGAVIGLASPGLRTKG